VTWLESRRQEVFLIKRRLEVSAESSKDSFDGYMRRSVKEVLYHVYPPRPESMEAFKERRRKYVGDTYTTLLQGVLGRKDAAEHVEMLTRYYELKPLEEYRIVDYIMKMVDMFPAQFLTGLVTECGKLTATQWIMRFEGVKGEARLNNYMGQPTKIDITPFIRVRVVKKSQG
jgi:hypothetical protein